MKWIYGLYVATLISCSFQEKSYTGVMKIDLEKSALIDPLSIIDSIQVINLERNNESLIGKVKKIQVFKDTIFVMDSRRQAILIFDKKGKFLNIICRKGKGPGEYIRLADFCIDHQKKEIILLPDTGNLLFYSFNGKFLNHLDIKDIVPHYIEYFDDSKVLLYSEISDYKLYMYDLINNKILFKDFINNDFSYKTGLGQLNSPFLRNNDGTFSLTGMYSYDIYSISSPTKINLTKLDFGKNSYDIEKFPLSKGKESFKKFYEKLLLDGKYAFNILYFFETKNHSFLSFFFNKRTNTLVYNKNNKTSNLLNAYLFPEVKQYVNGYLYTIEQPLNIQKYIPSNFPTKVNDANIDVNDNPVVIIYKFKNDV